MKVFCIDEPENGSGNDQKPPRFEKASKNEDELFSTKIPYVKHS